MRLSLARSAAHCGLLQTVVIATAVLVAGPTAASEPLPRAVSAASDPQGVRVIIEENHAALALREYSGTNVSLAPFVGAAAVDTAEILFQARSERVIYVVLRVAGPTRRKGGAHYCGAGRETNLVWLKVSGAQVIDATTVLYESCAFSIEPGELRATTEGFNVRYDSFTEKRTFDLQYDHRAPERGFSLTTKPLAD
jgi:hypothetical protein